MTDAMDDSLARKSACIIDTIGGNDPLLDSLGKHGSPRIRNPHNPTQEEKE